MVSSKLPPSGLPGITHAFDVKKMYGNLLMALAAVGVIAQISVLTLARVGVLGHGESAFHRFVGYGGSVAVFAVVTALSAIILVSVRWSHLFAAAVTLFLCTLTVGIFAWVVAWGAGG